MTNEYGSLNLEPSESRLDWIWAVEVSFQSRHAELMCAVTLVSFSFFFTTLLFVVFNLNKNFHQYDGLYYKQKITTSSKWICGSRD